MWYFCMHLECNSFTLLTSEAHRGCRPWSVLPAAFGRHADFPPRFEILQKCELHQGLKQEGWSITTCKNEKLTGAELVESTSQTGDNTLDSKMQLDM